MYQQLADKLKSRDLIILDGGTGTDIQARGAPMDGETWCAEVNITHPAIVQAVHEDYIAAGAEIITANTFATSALNFNHLNRDADVPRIDKVAVEIARRASKGRVAVAGSMSTMRPVLAGSDRNLLQREWPEAQARKLFEAKAQGLKAAGVDVIMMELLRDADYGVWATQAALETGLPVWLGLSVETDAQGRMTGFGRPDQFMEDFVPALLATNPEAISIMHSSPNDTSKALPFVKAHWNGPIGVYPESGYFAMPDWKFVDIIPPDELVRVAKEWRAEGVSLLGGCCGIGPQHIAALSKAFT